MACQHLGSVPWRKRRQGIGRPSECPIGGRLGQLKDPAGECRISGAKRERPLVYTPESDTVSVAARAAVTSTYVICQSLCSRGGVVRDEEAAGSNPATPTQVKGHSPPWDGHTIRRVHKPWLRTVKSAELPGGFGYVVECVGERCWSGQEGGMAAVDLDAPHA